MKRNKLSSTWFSILALLLLFTGVTNAGSQPNSGAIQSNGYLTFNEMNTLALLAVSVEKLQADVDALNKTLDTYIKAGNTCDLDLTIVITGLDIIALVNSDLSNVDQDIAVVYDLLGIAKQIPATSSQAQSLMSKLEKIRPSVKKALTSTTDANAKIIPIRNKLNAVDQKIRTLVKTAGTLETVLAKYSTVLGKAQQCVNSMPDGKTKDSFQSDINRLTDATDPSIVKANNALKDIINVVNGIERSIQSTLKPLLDPLHALEDDLEKLTKNLKNVSSPLHDLKSLFDKEFGIDIPYWSPTLTHPKRIKYKSIGIGFNVIIQGEDAIKKEIEKIVGKVLYKAAEAIGIGGLIKDVINAATGEFNTIQGKLSLGFDVDVPGLGDMKMNMDNLVTGLNPLGSLDIDTQPIDDILKAVNADIQTLENILAGCK